MRFASAWYCRNAIHLLNWVLSFGDFQSTYIPTIFEITDARDGPLHEIDERMHSPLHLVTLWRVATMGHCLTSPVLRSGRIRQILQCERWSGAAMLTSFGRTLRNTIRSARQDSSTLPETVRITRGLNRGYSHSFSWHGFWLHIVHMIVMGHQWQASISIIS